MKNGQANKVFSSLELADINKDVRKAIPGVKLREASVYHTSFRGTWDFRFRGYYWSGRADSAADAKVKGWSAYLAKLGVEGYNANL